jgi:hypothetical protein
MIDDDYGDEHYEDQDNDGYDEGYQKGQEDAKYQTDTPDRVCQEEEDNLRFDENVAPHPRERTSTDHHHTIEMSASDKSFLTNKNFGGGICSICSEYLEDDRCPNIRNHRRLQSMR